MALRKPKISSEIIQTCNKYLSSSAEATIRNKPQPNLNTEKNIVQRQPLRYKIANTEKPQRFQQICIREEVEPLFADLQPSANPEFKCGLIRPRWDMRPKTESPFPASIRSAPPSEIYSDKQKAEDKFVKFKLTAYTTTRNFSTTATRRYSRSKKNKDDNSRDCDDKGNKCAKPRRERCKTTDDDCPRHLLKDCKQSKGSNCDLRYLDPNCTKKAAPYPSYSEACAEHLPDDPSECQQCPWRVCDGADTIEPQKNPKNKRHYSTYCHRHLDATGGIVGPDLPPPDGLQYYICGKKKCGVTKKPCKEPGGPCEKQKIREAEEKQRGKFKYPDSKKKAADIGNQMVLGGFKKVNPMLMINPYTLEPVRIGVDCPSLRNQQSWIDILDREEALFEKRKQKWPNCHKGRKPKRPKAAVVDNDEVTTIEYTDHKWWIGRSKKYIITEPPGILLFKKHKMVCRHRRGDEGQPPPCKEKVEKSKRCPKEKLKKPKYQRRPMKDSYYKRPEDPYNHN